MPLYSYGGLRIESPVPIGGWSCEGEADAVVELGPVASELNDPVVRRRRMQGKPGQWLARPREGVAVEVIGGSRVILELGPEVAPQAAAGVLEHVAIPALLSMRGLLPVHASAVLNAGRAWLFLGRTRAGKSSLSAALLALGMTVVCDDLSAVAVHPSPMLLGGTGLLKIPSALVRQLPGLTAEPLDDGLRARCGVALPPREGPWALGGAFVLVPGASPSIAALSAPAAVHALLTGSYDPHFARAFGIGERYLLDCSELARQIPVCSLTLTAGEELEAARFFQGSATSAS